jgi:hypothetical protein
VDQIRAFRMSLREKPTISQALPAILDPSQDGYDDTAEGVPGDPAAVEDLFEPPIAHLIFH